MTTRPIQSPGIKYIENKVKVQKLHPKAEFPSKEKQEDIGWDITLIARTENRAEDDSGAVNNFSTGITVSPPEGYYFEMVAQKDLHKHGYMLATGTSIITPDTKGEIVVPLYKYADVEDIDLPLVAVKLILRQTVYAHLQSVKSFSHSHGNQNTYRGEFVPQMQQLGTFIPNPQSGSKYEVDMTAYQNQTSRYPAGFPRPQAAPPKDNHMF